MRTAEIIARGLGLEVQKTAALREIDEGEWEGLTEREIEAKWPELWADRATVRRPGGETPGEAVDRALHFLTDAAERHPGETIIAVTHQSLVRWIYYRCKGTPDPRCNDPRWPANAEVVEIQISADGSLSRDPGPRVA